MQLLILLVYLLAYGGPATDAVAPDTPCLELAPGHQCFVVQGGAEIPTPLCELPTRAWEGTISFWVMRTDPKQDAELWMVEWPPDMRAGDRLWGFDGGSYEDLQAALASWQYGAVICRQMKDSN